MASISVRMPDAMLERIKQAAGEDIRSVNGEILWLIGQGLARRERQR